MSEHWSPAFQHEVLLDIHSADEFYEDDMFQDLLKFTVWECQYSVSNYSWDDSVLIFQFLFVVPVGISRHMQR